MLYVVLHPEVGVVCGPDLVFTGSKVAQVSQKDKGEVLKPWHVPVSSFEMYTHQWMLWLADPLLCLQVVAGQAQSKWSAAAVE
jgi:hypothetical protein